MSLFKLVFISSLMAINPLCAMLRVDQFSGPRDNQVSRVPKGFQPGFSIPYDVENPDKNIPKRPSQECWEKKAKHIQFTQNAPEEIKKRIVSHIFPASAVFGSEIAAEKFLIMDPHEAARHIERAEILTQNPKTSMPVEIPFLFNKKQQQMIRKMNLHFADENVTTIPVSRDGWLIIQSLPKKVKCEFRNEEEFYTAELMRDNTDKTLYVASQAVQGGLKGVVPGFAAGYVGSGVYLLHQAAPEISKNTFKKTNSVAIAHFGQSLQQGFDSADSWRQRQSDLFEEENNVDLKYGAEILRGTRKAMVHDYIKTGIGIAKEEAANKTKEICTDNFANPQVLSTTMQSFGIGATLGIANGLLTMDEPIQKQSISKIV